MSDTDRPFVEVTLRTHMPLPDGTTEEEALEAARESFNSEMESDDVDVELRYVDTDTDRSGVATDG